MKNVLFEGSRAVLFKDSYTELKRLVTLLKENNKINILVIGHICCQYDNRDAFDIDTGIKNLSKARANTIKEYLIDNGIAPERIKTKGAKGMSPLGGSVEFDRRVEIEIIS